MSTTFREYKRKLRWKSGMRKNGGIGDVNEEPTETQHSPGQMPLPIPDESGFIPFYRPGSVDPNHSPDAGEVHLLSAQRASNGLHNVMVIDANGMSQWPTQHSPGQYSWDDPSAIVTPPHVIDQAHDYARELDEYLGNRRHDRTKQNSPNHPDPWMDNEPGAVTFPDAWAKKMRFE